MGPDTFGMGARRDHKERCARRYTCYCRTVASLVRLPLDYLSPASEPQARQRFDPARLETLARSLKRSGLREPIIVRPDANTPGRYRIVAGERRWRAARLAGLTDIPCLVDEALADPKQRLLAQAEENLHREDLNAVEEATVLVQLMDAFGINAQEAGALIGRSYQQARRLIQISGAPQPIRDAIAWAHIDTRAALELVRIYNKLACGPGADAKSRALAQVEDLIDRVVNDRWSIRRLERFARDVAGGGGDVGKSNGTAAGDAAASHLAAVVSRGVATTPARAAAGPPFRRTEGGVFIDTNRVARRQVSPEEREELIRILEELLMAVRRA